MCAKKNMHYYEARNGVWLDTVDLENAFLVMTGEYRSKTPDAFIKFVRDLEGKTIKRIDTPTLEDLVDKKLYTMAMRKVKYETGCSSAQANDVVRRIVKARRGEATPMQKAILKAQANAETATVTEEPSGICYSDYCHTELICDENGDMPTR